MTTTAPGQPVTFDAAMRFLYGRHAFPELPWPSPAGEGGDGHGPTTVGDCLCCDAEAALDARRFCPGCAATLCPGCDNPGAVLGGSGYCPDCDAVIAVWSRSQSR